MPSFTRRSALMAGAVLPFAGGVLPFAGAAMAAAPKQGASFARVHRFSLGAFEVTTLLANTLPRDEPQGIFGMNVSPEEFEAVSRAAFIPTDKAQFFFTPVLVNTGAELILFDTGTSADAITEVLAEAGHSPDQVDTVVLTHMHGDHIGGMMTDGSPTFGNARYVTGQVEFDSWAAAGNDGFNANVAPMADKMSFLAGGDDVVSGITAIEAFGHTAGHMAYMLESEGQQLALIGDAANHPVWSLERPDWEVRFDSDKAAAAAARRSLFGMLAADRVPFVGYHMPFPGIGYVEPREDGFRYVPTSYQTML